MLWICLPLGIDFCTEAFTITYPAVGSSNWSTRSCAAANAVSSPSLVITSYSIHYTKLYDVVLFGCSGAVPGSPAPSPRVRSVAVASLALELDPKAEALLPAPDGGLLQDAADALLQISEAQLARNWQVVPALTYSASEGYRLLALEPSDVLLRPQAGDAELGVFASYNFV